jgi:Fe-S-cluster-containing hydrogenase component 2
MSGKDYRVVPKPEPTPIFDAWKQCPTCMSDETEVQVEYKDTVRSSHPDYPELRIIKTGSQVIIVNFLCRDCLLESEKRVCILDNATLVAESLEGIDEQ